MLFRPHPKSELNQFLAPLLGGGGTSLGCSTASDSCGATSPPSFALGSLRRRLSSKEPIGKLSRLGMDATSTERFEGLLSNAPAKAGEAPLSLDRRRPLAPPLLPVSLPAAALVGTKTEPLPTPRRGNPCRWSSGHASGG